MADTPFPALTIAPRSGSEPFHTAGVPTGFGVLAFWRWAASDLVGNALRGVLAEFLVAQAVGGCENVRAEWDACDLRTVTGLRIEVKSAAYLQSWSQRALSNISFDIAPKRGWDATTNTSALSPCRSSDVYVFALLAHQEKATVDPLDLAQWQFYVVSARRLDATFGTQKRITLKALLRVVPEALPFAELGAALASVTTRAPAV